MENMYGSDAFSPSEIAKKVETIGVTKARLPLLPMMMLGFLAGVFISIGAMFYVIIISDAQLSFGISRVLGGIVFSLGLVMVVVAGAELFTGNNLLVMAWADGKISWKEVLRNWSLVCLTNFSGAASFAFILFLSKHHLMNGGSVGATYVKIATAKCTLPFQQALFSGFLCNVLVCLAVWMSQAGRTVSDKVLALIFPVAAFVAAGFEHCIANMFFVPMAMLVQQSDATLSGNTAITWLGLGHNLLPVIIGNLMGGGMFVALFYYVIYRRGAAKS